MTQVVFLKKAELPSKSAIQECINQMGYDFTFLDNMNTPLNQNGLECSISHKTTQFMTILSTPDEIIDDADWISDDLDDEDLAISFMWGADYAAGACVSLISLALIDLCGALIFYLDDEVPYTREMLLDDIPQFLEAL